MPARRLLQTARGSWTPRSIGCGGWTPRSSGELQPVPRYCMAAGCGGRMCVQSRLQASLRLLSFCLLSVASFRHTLLDHIKGSASADVICPSQHERHAFCTTHQPACLAFASQNQ